MIEQATEQPAWIIRHANLGNGERDCGPVFASWRASYWDGWAKNKGINHDMFIREFDMVMESIVHDRAGTITLVACDPENTGHLFSWMCAEQDGDALVLHYVYTFEPFRKFGIASALLQRFMQDKIVDKLVASHRTKTSKQLETHKYLMTYNPYRKYRFMQDKIVMTYNPYRKYR